MLKKLLWNIGEILEDFEGTFKLKFLLIKFKEICGKVFIFTALANYYMHSWLLQN